MIDKRLLGNIEALDANELRDRLRLCLAELDRLVEENIRLQRMVSVAAFDAEKSRDA
ncbi:MAG: hypothetical protein HYU58_19745 [Proteobacteria bacterium]|nr:hypothetical protein [Pseudomonadota bacterium]